MKNKINKSEKYWKSFENTGKIEDYIIYRSHKKKEEQYERTIKEKGDYSQF